MYLLGVDCQKRGPRHVTPHPHHCQQLREVSDAFPAKEPKYTTRKIFFPSMKESGEQCTVVFAFIITERRNTDDFSNRVD